MHVFIERTGEQKAVEFTGTIAALLKKLGVNPETVIVSRNGELLVQEDSLDNADQIKIHSVVSGG